MLSNIPEPGKASHIVPLFRLAFRPFFLGAALFSLIALTLWGSFWLNGASWTPYGGWMWWHAHEMLFGFVCAVIVGFLLTAVQNWTGQDSLSGWPLATIFSLWLLARLLLLYPMPATVAMLPWLDLAFLPVAAGVMGRLVWQVRQYHNFIFVPVLLLLSISNAQMHWAAVQEDAALFKQGAHGAIFLVVLLMIVLGGRVIPFFTATATATARSKPNLWIEIPSIASVATLALLQLFGLLALLPALLVAGLFLIAALSHLVRLLSWRPWATTRQPLLWSLHAAYLFIALGFLLCAFHFLGLALAWSGMFVTHYATLLHSFTLGGMGLLIIAMMSRVALGHTGRELTVSSWMSFAFACLCAAYICRIWLPLLWPGSVHYAGYLLSIAFWLLGYGVFVIHYLPILSQPRIDGRPG